VGISGLSGVVAMDGGTNHSLALRSDGSVFSWGFNTVGELGDGTTTERDTPDQWSGLGGAVVAIAAGLDHSLALRQNGTVLAWGYNGNGQLGDGRSSTAPFLSRSMGSVASQGLPPGEPQPGSQE